MPQYKTHIVGGILFFSVPFFFLQNYYHISFLTACEWLLCAILGSLFPDVDITSKGRKIFYRVVGPLFMYCVVMQNSTYMSIVGSIALFPLFVRHRGIFHRVWFIAALSVLVSYITFFCAPRHTTAVVWDMVFFALGALSHIWLDFGIKRMIRFK
jgi:hypothetical protein